HGQVQRYQLAVGAAVVLAREHAGGDVEVRAGGERGVALLQLRAVVEIDLYGRRGSQYAGAGMHGGALAVLEHAQQHQRRDGDDQKLAHGAPRPWICAEFTRSGRRAQPASVAGGCGVVAVRRPRREADAGSVAAGEAAECASSSSAGSCRNTSARRCRKACIAELLRHTIAMRRLGAWPLNSIRCRPSTGATGGCTAITGSRVMPTLAATIWRRVSRLVARKPECSPAPAMWQTSSAWSRRQWPSSSSSRFWL